MATNVKSANGPTMLAELQEFASFDPAAQRYIRRALDVAFDRADAVPLWSRDRLETASIRNQTKVYEGLHVLRGLVPINGTGDDLDRFMGRLILISAFDLGQGRIRCFAAFRFLYERLLGASVRPWLPAAFCAASALPHMPPPRRRDLLQSISEAAATAPAWSLKEPGFYPEWVERVEDDAG